MNTDTQHTLESILTNGYYPKGTSMGEGGWPEFYRRTHGEPTWNKYLLIVDDIEFPPEVFARSAQCAHRCFENTYLLPDHYEIVQVVTSRAVVYSQ